MEVKDLQKALDERDNAITAKLDTLDKKVKEHSEKFDVREELEARGDTPGKIGKKPVEYKVYETNHGQVFELPSHIKMADVIQERQQPQISLERWLSAAVAGEKCGDAEAVRYARERKDLLTTSTGIMVPQEYQSAWIDLIRAQSVLNAAGMRTITMNAKT